MAAAQGSPSLARECDRAKPSWIWCDDFDRDRLSSYFEYDSARGSFLRMSQAGVDGSYAMTATFAPGQVGAGSLHLALGRTPQRIFRPADAGVEKYQEIYWRIYLRHAPTWIGGGGDKLSRVTSLVSPSSWAQSMIAHVWSMGPGNTLLGIDPASGTDVVGNLRSTTYNDFPRLRWLGKKAGLTPIFARSHVGRWYCIEAHVRLNQPGRHDGRFQLWIDDKLEAVREGLNWTGAFQGYGLNAVFLENYWNRGSPVAQSRSFDNFVVSRERIGC
jgi:hypothetical protein